MTGGNVLWRNVEELVGRARSIEALRIHGLELIAASLWRRQGRDLPSELQLDANRAAVQAMAAPVLLKRAVAAYDGKLMLMKGPELAAHYPDPEIRPFRDLDLLVDDADAAQRELVAAGFIEVGDPEIYENVHHLRPLAWPGLPLVLELHREPNRALWLDPPPAAEILELTQPSATGTPGLLAPTPAAHALLVAAHSWVHEPLRRVLDLIDVAVTLDDSERDEASELALWWGVDGVWRATLAAVDGLLRGRRRGQALRLWGRHLTAVRERRVLETHLALWAGSAYGLPSRRGQAIGAATVAFTKYAHPRGDEGWKDALSRTSRALVDAFVAQSQHDRIREESRG